MCQQANFTVVFVFWLNFNGCPLSDVKTIKEGPGPYRAAWLMLMLPEKRDTLTRKDHQCWYAAVRILSQVGVFQEL